MFVCVECGAANTHLCEQISPSVLKLSQCVVCDAVVDKYVEYDGVLVLLDMLLLKTNVYRHVVFNRRQVGEEKEVYTKYSNGTSPPAPTAREPSAKRYYTRTIILLFLSSLTADTYVTWLNDKQTDGKLLLHVLEIKFMIRLAEVLVQTIAFYLTAAVLSYVMVGVRDFRNLLPSLVISSFAKLFAIPSAMWSQNTNLLVLSYILVLANNVLVVYVMCSRRVRSVVVVLAAFAVERYISFRLCRNVWPWDTLYLYNVTLYLYNVTLGSNLTSDPLDYYIFWEPVGRKV